ncbi:MAG TPA: preprotein translocase subunit SecY [Planctomycetota bacterium]|nr:preprotein translocase subunit SecY [Planctomycetota bacterium]
MRAIEQLRNAFKIKELRDRIFVTLGLLVIFRMGSHIPIPGVNPESIRQFAESAQNQYSYFWSVLSILSGGAITMLGLFSLGIMPYITSSIILSLLTKVHPALEALSKEGPSGQRRISQYTRLLTLPIALLQSIMALKALPPDLFVEAGFFNDLLMVIALTSGALFVMWLSEQISEFGLGNGASMLIMAGIVGRMPVIAAEFYTEIQRNSDFASKVLIIVGLYLAMIVAIVFITQSQRRIPMQAAKHFRGRRVVSAGRNYLPLKINTAGVMPVIFASSLMVVPQLIAQIPGMDWLQGEFRSGRFLYGIFYVVTIFFFSYFWTYLFFQPVEMANNLKEYGSFIPGIRPGENTANYINFILSRITFCGAAFLCFVALVPDVVSGVLGMDRWLVAFMGGTGILIVVGVCLDVLQKMESYLLLHHYGGITGAGAMRGRR